MFIVVFFGGEAGWVPVDLHVKFENFLVFFYRFVLSIFKMHCFMFDLANY